MTSVPRSYCEYSDEEVEAARRYEGAQRALWEFRVDEYAREFYEDVRSPTPDDPFELTCTVTLDGEQYKCTFDVELWEIDPARSRSRVNWDLPGKVEVTYIADGSIRRHKTIDLILEDQYGSGTVGIFIDNWDDMEMDILWNDYLLIFLKFDENTIRYHNPDTPYLLEVVEDVVKRHFEIYASPQASRGREFEGYGFVNNEEEADEIPSLSQSDASSVSY